MVIDINSPSPNWSTYIDVIAILRLSIGEDFCRYWKKFLGLRVRVRVRQVLEDAPGGGMAAMRWKHMEMTWSDMASDMTVTWSEVE